MSRFWFVALWFVAAFVSGIPRSASAEDGLLLIDVGMVRLNELGQQSAWEPVSSYTLRNLNTGRKYEFRYFLSLRVSAEEVEEGDYCIESVYAYLSNTILYFCDEPFFKVVADRVNNGGSWRFAVSDGPPTRKLVFGPKDFEATMDEAKKFNKSLLRKYGVAVD